eukprot:15447533-Alexandrium_andersonii.AAC.1
MSNSPQFVRHRPRELERPPAGNRHPRARGSAPPSVRYRRAVLRRGRVGRMRMLRAHRVGEHG